MDSQEPEGQHHECIRLAVLEERVDGLVRANQERDSRLANVERKITELADKVDAIVLGIEQRFARSEMAANARLVAILMALLTTAIGIAWYVGQMLMGHITGR